MVAGWLLDDKRHLDCGVTVDLVLQVHVILNWIQDLHSSPNRPRIKSGVTMRWRVGVCSAGA